MEDIGTGSRNKRYPRDSVARPGSPRYRGHPSRVCSLSLTQWLASQSYGRQLHSSRPPLSDVPAIYFVSPTITNIRRIAEDLEKALYESYHLNFSEPLPRALLEELAAAVAKDGTNEYVEQVRNLQISSVTSC